MHNTKILSKIKICMELENKIKSFDMILMWWRFIGFYIELSSQSILNC